MPAGSPTAGPKQWQSSRQTCW